MRTQAEQIAAIRADQKVWRALAAEVGPARYAEPGRVAGPDDQPLVADYDGSYDRLIEALEGLPAHLQSATVPWTGEPLVDVDFTGHLRDEHVAPVRAWLDRSRAS
jgi:hypothetical protein